MRPSRTLTGLSRPQVIMLQLVFLLSTLVAFASSLALPDDAANTVLHDDAAIDAAPRGALQDRQSGIKIMIVGDSISQGENGDYTWRYRIWQWMQSQGVSVQFVGPWVGTMGHGDPQPPQPPPLQGQSAPTVPVDTNGDYADDVDTAGWNPHHLSKWGWQCAQAKDVIQEMVSTYQPDMLLVELGFNDIGWFVSDAEGTAVSMSLFISNARAANSNIKIALANIPQRTSLGAWRADLPVKTTAYNTALPGLIQSWTTSQSPIYLVDFAGNYDCHVDGCPAGYDGLHPNALGEYQIAQAFSKTLVSSFGIGSNPLQIPASIPVRPAPVPTNVVAAGSPVGVTVTWDKVHSARTYEVRSRLAGAGNWTVTDTDVNGYYTTWCVDGQQWEYQVRTRNIDQGSDWSDIVSAQCATQAPGQVTNVYTEPSLLGMTISWDPPTERGGGVNLYQIITLDTDVAGAYVQTFGVTGTRAFVQDLTPGHHYAVSVVAWSSIGGGFPQGGLAVVPGYTDPPPTPSNLMLTSIDGTTMQFSWCGDPSAAGYRYWVRSVGNDSAEYSVTPFTGATTTDTVYFLFPGVWTYEYCVDAMNGNLTSGRSQCIQGAQPPNSIGGPVGSGAGCYQCLAEPCNPSAEYSDPGNGNTNVTDPSKSHSSGDGGDPNPPPGTGLPDQNTPQPWTQISCSMLNLTSDLVSPQSRWQVANATAAWQDCLQFYRDYVKQYPTTNRQFSEIVSDRVHATSDRRCLNVPDTNCDTTFPCDDETTPGAKGVSSPAGYMIINSFANLHNIIDAIDTGLKAALEDVQAESSGLAEAFTDFSDARALAIGLDIFSAIYGVFAASLWNSWVTKLGSYGNWVNTVGVLKDASNSLVAFGVGLAKDLSTDPLLATAAVFSELAGNIVTSLRTVNVQTAAYLFNGTDASINALTHFIDGGNSAQSDDQSPFDIESYAVQVLIAYLIPVGWSASGTFGFIMTAEGLDQYRNGDACEASSWDLSQIGITKATSFVCVDNTPYWLVKGTQTLCTSGKEASCTPAHPIGDAPGVDKLDGKNFNGLQKKDLVQSALNAFNAHGGKNGWAPLDPTNSGALDDVTTNGVKTAGIFNVPICSNLEAATNLDGAAGKKTWSTYPCNKP